MSLVAVNIIKVLFVTMLYGFLFYVARSMRGHIAGPPVEAATKRRSGAAVATPRPPERRTLLITNATGTTRHNLDGTLVVGRGSTADVQLEDEFTSERHATFILEGGQVWVEDLGSTNGTNVDGVAVEGRAEIPIGGVVTLGHTRVELT